MEAYVEARDWVLATGTSGTLTEDPNLPLTLRDSTLGRLYAEAIGRFRVQAWKFRHSSRSSRLSSYWRSSGGPMYSPRGTRSPRVSAHGALPPFTATSKSNAPRFRPTSLN